MICPEIFRSAGQRSTPEPNGNADTVVDYRQSVALDQALTVAGVAHEFYIIPGATHGVLTKPFLPTPAERAAVWLTTQLSKAAAR